MSGENEVLDDVIRRIEEMAETAKVEVAEMAAEARKNLKLDTRQPESDPLDAMWHRLGG